jgi:hypothetical protein
VGVNDKDVGDSDKELITAAERDFKHQARQPTDHFGKLLEATYPNHTYPVQHKMKECTMMKNYMTTGKATTPFPEEKAVLSIYGEPTPTSPGVCSNLLTEQSTS